MVVVSGPGVVVVIGSAVVVVVPGSDVVVVVTTGTVVVVPAVGVVVVGIGQNGQQHAPYPENYRNWSSGVQGIVETKLYQLLQQQFRGGETTSSQSLFVV